MTTLDGAAPHGVLRCLLPLFLAACGGDRTTYFTMGVTRRDSAGVHIVQTRAESMRIPAWKLEASPTLDFANGTTRAHQFSRIRGMTRLSDGRFVILDAATCEIRFFSAQGSPLSAVGGCGREPGQFTALWLAGRRPDDALLVWDNQLSGLTLVAPDGRTTRAAEFANEQPRMTFWNVFSDGRLLATSQSRLAPATVGTSVQDTIVLWDVDARTVERHLIIKKPGVHVLAYADRLEEVPFTGNPVFTTAHEDVVIASGSAAVIERWSRAGRLLAKYVDVRPASPLNEAEISEYRDGELRSVEPAKAAARLRELSTLPFPRLKLAYDRLLAGPNGEIWARDYEWRTERDYHWSVMDSTGALIARVRTPSFLEIDEITVDGVLGHGPDENGKEHAWLYRIERRNSK
jgi:hypothetical protein